MSSPTAIDPAKSTSTVSVRVRFAETDLMGIVHHANYFGYFEIGRVEWLRRRGVAYTDFLTRGVHLPVIDAQATYRAPCRFDECLDVVTTLTKARSVSVVFGYRILRQETLIATGSTRLACIDDAHAIARIPEDLFATLLGGERA